MENTGSYSLLILVDEYNGYNTRVETGSFIADVAVPQGEYNCPIRRCRANTYMYIVLFDNITNDMMHVGPVITVTERARFRYHVCTVSDARGGVNTGSFQDANS
jgi:hypothetical protein